MCIKPDIHKQRSHLLRIHTASYSELMDRTSAAMEQKAERFLRPLHLVCHIVKSPRPEDCSHCILDIFPTEVVSRPDFQLAHQVAGFLFRDAGNLNLRHKDRACTQVYGLGIPQHLIPSTCQGQYAVQLVRHRLGCLQAAPDDDINALVIEAHHIVFREIRLDRDIRNADILLI